MSYIFQPARIELLKQIERYKKFVTGRVLDVGAGPVARYRHLFDCSEYVRMDIEGTPNIDVVGLAEAIPFPDNFFDTVFSTQVLEDVWDVQRAFSEFYRVLAPNGVLFITTGFLDAIKQDPGEYWRFTHNALRRLAEEVGFNIEVIEQRGGYWSVVGQLGIRRIILKYDLYKDRWHTKPLRAWITFYGRYMLLKNAYEKRSDVFPHGYLLIARKNT